MHASLSTLEIAHEMHLNIEQMQSEMCLLKHIAHIITEKLMAKNISNCNLTHTSLCAREHEANDENKFFHFEM